MVYIATKGDLRALHKPQHRWPKYENTFFHYGVTKCKLYFFEEERDYFIL